MVDGGAYCSPWPAGANVHNTIAITVAFEVLCVGQVVVGQRKTLGNLRLCHKRQQKYSQEQDSMEKNSH